MSTTVRIVTGLIGFAMVLAGIQLTAPVIVAGVLMMTPAIVGLFRFAGTAGEQAARDLTDF